MQTQPKLVTFLLQSLGYLWYLALFLVLIPGLLYHLGLGLDYLVIDSWLGSVRVGSILPSVLLDILTVFLILLGAVLIVEAGSLLVREGETFPFSVVSHKHARPAKLIQNGLYKRVRHPMLLGYLVVLMSWGVYLRSPSVVFWLVPITGMVILEYLLMTEEQQLRKWFGDEYARYRSRTSVLIPGLF